MSSRTFFSNTLNKLRLISEYLFRIRRFSNPERGCETIAHLLTIASQTSV